MNKKIKKQNSKKGMTLVELLVGVAIVVIVFAGTVGAMVGGYSTTVNNADQNKAAAINESVNEIIMNTVKKLDLLAEDAADCVSALESGSLEVSGADSNAVAIKGAVDSKCKNLKMDATEYYKFIKSGDFPKDGVDYQYTLITDQTTNANGQDISGIIVKTAMKSSSGFVINQSFVPYK